MGKWALMKTQFDPNSSHPWLIKSCTMLEDIIFGWSWSKHPKSLKHENHINILWKGSKTSPLWKAWSLTVSSHKNTYTWFSANSICCCHFNVQKLSSFHQPLSFPNSYLTIDPYLYHEASYPAPKNKILIECMCPRHMLQAWFILFFLNFICLVKPPSHPLSLPISISHLPGENTKGVPI